MNQLIGSRIFVSYSHRGNGPKWKAALLNALHVFERQHLLDVWQDGKIRNSSYWEDDINQAIASAQLAVILLTHEALESQFILEKELPFLRKRQIEDKLPVFPVICDPCNWKNIDWLRATQAPNASNPLSQLSVAAQDQVFRKLATDIAEELSRNVLNEFSKPGQEIIPANVYLDKFPLTKSGGKPEKLIGREQELALLDLAFTQPNTAIVSLVAWGGVGKTMLIQHWLQRLQHEDWFGVRRIFAWSFYSQGTQEDRQTSEDSFLAHALDWFGVQCEPTLSPWDKGRLLAEAIAHERTLLILDGIEPLQYPPGPMGGQLRAPGVQNLLKQLARKANNIGLHSLCLVTTRELLSDLADFERRPDAAWGSVLRVNLGNLTDEAGAALLYHSGAKRAGAADIKAGDAELRATSREVDGHALTLNLLGRFLARAHGGDIRRRDLVQFEDADRKEQGGTTFKMLRAFENWFDRSGDFGARRHAVLRLFGLFNGLVGSDCLAVLRCLPMIPGLTEPLFVFRKDHAQGSIVQQALSEEDWKETLSFLIDFGIISEYPVARCSIRGYSQQDATKIWNADKRNENRWIELGEPKPFMSSYSANCNLLAMEVHPLVREYFATQLRQKMNKSWRFANLRLYEHFRNSVPYWPDGIEGINLLYDAVKHGCEAGLYQEICDEIFRDRILRGTYGLHANYSQRMLGANSSDLAALGNFFTEPWKKLCPELNEYAQTWLLYTVAFHLCALGRLTEASEIMQSAIELTIIKSDWENSSVIASNLSGVCLKVGDSNKAIHFAKQGVIFADRSGEISESIGCRAALAHALHQIGHSANARVCFDEAESIQSIAQPGFPLLYSLSGFQYCDLLLLDSEYLAWKTTIYPHNFYINSEIYTLHSSIAQRALKTQEWMKMYCGGNLDIALNNLTLARVALYDSIFTNKSVNQQSANLFNFAVDGIRHTGNQDELPLSLLTRAWYNFLKCDRFSAKTDLDEAFDIAERGPMRLHMADIHLYRARLFFREKIYPWKSPQDDLAAAEKLINECGYHRRDEELEDAKSIILNGKQ
jgi:hypothetical protein